MPFSADTEIEFALLLPLAQTGELDRRLCTGTELRKPLKVPWAAVRFYYGSLLTR
jgi:hypothetical protein